jgi:hypothetical protein
MSDPVNRAKTHQLMCAIPVLKPRDAGRTIRTGALRGVQIRGPSSPSGALTPVRDEETGVRRWRRQGSRFTDLKCVSSLTRGLTRHFFAHVSARGPAGQVAGVWREAERSERNATI